VTGTSPDTTLSYAFVLDRHVAIKGIEQWDLRDEAHNDEVPSAGPACTKQIACGSTNKSIQHCKQFRTLRGELSFVQNTPAKSNSSRHGAAEVLRHDCRYADCCIDLFTLCTWRSTAARAIPPVQWLAAKFLSCWLLRVVDATVLHLVAPLLAKLSRFGEQNLDGMPVIVQW
jgi:hypothetical protein